jgi:hypothetical protein
VPKGPVGEPLEPPLSALLDPGSPAFIVILMFGVFLAYGGWTLFRPPRRRP